MAFKFKWPEFEEAFVEKARQQMERTLNNGRGKPISIVDTIFVKELSLGTLPPELDILEVSELSDDRFRGFFQLVYRGDAFVILQTKIQANPISSAIHGHHAINRSPRLYEGPTSATASPLALPMQLKISALRFRGILVVSMSRYRGIKLFFKNDPLESIEVSSTFDSLPSIRRYLQNEIESQLRKAFLEAIPAIVYQFTSKETSSEQSANFEELKETHHEFDSHSNESHFPVPSTPLQIPLNILTSLQSHAFSDDFAKSPPHIKNLLVRQLMSPARNSLTAELAQMLNCSSTLSPFGGTQVTGHVSYRTDPTLFRSTARKQRGPGSSPQSTLKLPHQRSTHLLQHDLDFLL